jgi:hypothetical protein
MHVIKANVPPMHARSKIQYTQYSWRFLYKDKKKLYCNVSLLSVVELPANITVIYLMGYFPD